MKTQAKILKTLILIAFLALGCSKSDDSNPVIDPEPDLTNIDGIIKQGSSNFEEVPQARTTDTTNVAEPQGKDVTEPVLDEDGNNLGDEEVPHRYVCTTKTISVLDGNSEYPLFNGNPNVIYPGNLIQWKSLENATPSPIPVKRGSGTISYNLVNGNTESSRFVEEVSKSNVQTKMNEIIDGAVEAGNVVPAEFTLDIVQVQSEEQLSLELGLKVKTFAVKAKSNLSYSTNSEFNSFLVKLKQVYYTMSYDLPTSVDEFFHESVTPEQLSTYVQDDNPATFIASVTYGRIFYMLIESKSSAREMAAKLDLSYGKFGNSVSGSVDVDAFNSMKETKIKIMAYGGDAKGAIQLAGETNISEVANRLAEGTDIRAGSPLSYELRSVERPDIVVGSRLATDYTLTECELKGILAPGLYEGLVDLFDDGIGTTASLGNSDVIVFNKAGNKYAWFNGNTASVLGDKKIFDITDPSGPLGNIELESVGAAVRYNNNPRILLFSGSGFEYQDLEVDPGKIPNNALPTEPIGTYYTNNTNNSLIFLVNEDLIDSPDRFFLSTEGIGAAIRIGSTSIALFGKNGDTYQTYNYYKKELSQLYNTNEWFVGQENSEGVQFDKVGAATNFTAGGTYRYFFVNEEGTEIQEWYSNASIDDFFVGPWVIN